MNLKTRFANCLIRFLNNNSSVADEKQLIINQLVDIISVDTDIFVLVSDYFNTENQSYDSFTHNYSQKLIEREKLINTFSN